jgi:hypothetical protein
MFEDLHTNQISGHKLNDTSGALGSQVSTLTMLILLLFVIQKFKVGVCPSNMIKSKAVP